MVRRDEHIYVQVYRRLPEESDREVANLLEIKDHYPKYVVRWTNWLLGISTVLRLCIWRVFCSIMNIKR